MNRRSLFSQIESTYSVSEFNINYRNVESRHSVFTQFYFVSVKKNVKDSHAKDFQACSVCSFPTDSSDESDSLKKIEIGHIRIDSVVKSIKRNRSSKNRLFN